MTSARVTVVGAGEVFRQRYLPALRELGAVISVPDVVDVRATDELEPELREGGGAEISVHQLRDASPAGLVSLLRARGLLAQPVVLATPSPLHVPQASALLEVEATVCIEKPYAVSRAQAADYDAAIGGCERPPFLLGYYALEKGLAALALARGAAAPEAYLEQLAPRIGAGRLGALRAVLGRVRHIRAVLLEGQGSAGRLEQRPWTLEQASGGNTVETFYHLVCMALAWLGPKVSVRSASLARHRETAERFHDATGRQMAETLTSARLESSEVEASLLCAKYVASSLHERWMEIEFERGAARVDFETASLVVESRDERLELGLARPTRYVTQLSLFARWLSRPDTPVEYTLFRDALLTTLSIRERGLREPVASYRTGDLTTEWRDRTLCGHTR